MLSSTHNKDTKPTKPENHESDAKPSLLAVSPRSWKKRNVDFNEFDCALDKALIMSSQTADLRRQQIKILKLFHQHLCSMESLDEHGNNRIKTVITDWLKSRSDMKAHILTELENNTASCATHSFSKGW